MDSHTDYTVKLKTNTGKYYSWCIQEFDAGVKQVGTDLTPWDDVQDFRVSNLRYYFNLKNSSFYSLFNGDEWEEDDESEEEVEAADQNKDLKASEVILADLTPSGEGRHQTTTNYSMVGTSRHIKGIRLVIAKSEEDGCQIWGSVSYTAEIDFRDETFDDVIQVDLNLTPNKFDRISRLINSRIVNEASLSLHSVCGFYSEPGTFENSTYSIKVLTCDREGHKLEIPENCEIEQPRLGKDFEFELQLGNNQGLISKDVDETDWADIDWAEERVDVAVTSISRDYTETEELSEDAEQLSEGTDAPVRDDDDWAEEKAAEVSSSPKVISERTELLKRTRK